MPQREKQRDRMFSLHPPLSFSFSPLAVDLSSSLQCSTNMQSDQSVWGVRSKGQDGRVWKARWESDAGEQSCQLNILSNSAELVSQWHTSGLLSLRGGSSVYYHTPCFVVTPGLFYVYIQEFFDEEYRKIIMNSERCPPIYALFYKTTLSKLKTNGKMNGN